MHFSTGVILKKENLELIKKDIIKERAKKRETKPLTDLELEFKSIESGILNLLDPYMSPDYDMFDEINLESQEIDALYDKVKLDWFVIGGRWNSCLPIKKSILEKKIYQRPKDFDLYTDDIASYAKIKDIDFINTFDNEETELIKCKKQYEDMMFNKNSLLYEDRFKSYPIFKEFKRHTELYGTHTFLTSNGEWIELYNSDIKDIKERRNKAKELFLSLLDKEDKEDIFVLVDCHI